MSKAFAQGSVCLALILFALLTSVPTFGQNFFTQGNLVVSVSGCGVHAGSCTSVPNGTGTGAGNSTLGGYGDNQASPLTLFQYSPNGTSSVSFVNSLVLPQATSGANVAVSAEYGSSSEGTLQLSGGGQYLTIMGYGIDDLSFNASPGTYGAAPSNALAQSGSLTGQSYTAVPRVVSLIDANGNVNSATAIYNIFNGNNPRSASTLNGSTAYVSGQGTSPDATGGVFYIPVGVVTTTPTAITGLDTNSKTSAQDTRDVQIVNNTLYVSVDSKEGSGSNRDFIGTLGTPPATGLFNSGNGPTQLTNFATSGAGKETITSGTNSNGNNLNAGMKINISPENYFFASPSVLYVADSGFPKNDSNGDNNSTGTASIGDGGLQKWTNTKSDGTGTWNLVYTLYQGLSLVNNGGTSGTTGLIGLAGTVSGNNVFLYTTNFTISDLDFTYLYGITDNLTFTTASQAAGETFTLLDTAPAGSNFKGVSFAPTIPAGSVEITSSPSGLSFTSAGTGCAAGTYTTPITLIWTPGNSCTLSVVSPQTASGVQYTFSQWQDGTTSTTDTVIAPSTSAVYTASFTTTTSMAVTSVTPSAEDYGQDAPVTITAVLSWGGSGPAPTASAVTIGGNGPSSYGATSCGTPSGNTMTCTNTYSPTTADTAGSYTESATFAGDSNYSASSSPQTNNFTINGATSTTSVSSGTNPSTYGQPVTFTATIDGEFGNTKTGKNGTKKQTVTGSVTWSTNTGCGTTSITSGNPGTATCTTSTLSVGNDTITATYSGDSNHSGSSGTLSGGQQVNLAGTTIAVTNVSPSNEDYGLDAPVTITAVLSWTGGGAAPTGTVTIGGNGPSTYGTTSCGAPSGTTITCTNTYSPTTADMAGSYTETATFAGDSNYSASSSPQTNNFTINQASASVSVGSSLNPSNYGQPVTFTATIGGEFGNVKTGKNGLKRQTVTGSVTWSANTGCGTTPVTSGNPATAMCTTSSLSGGNDTITATYSGDSNHSGSTGTLSGGQVVNPISQTITFTKSAPSSAVYNTTFTVTATASSGLAVTFTASGACSNVGGTYTMTSGSGTCSVMANQAGNSNYTAAPQVTQKTTANQATQTITVTTPAPATAVSGSSFTVAATASSGFTVAYGSLGGCTNSGATFTMASGGSTACTVTYNQSGNNNYKAAPQVTNTTTPVAGIPPTTSFTGAPSSAAYLTSFTVVATTNAGVNATITTAPTTVCTVSGTTVTIVKGSGTCTMTASWPATSVYAAATATQTTTAVKSTPVVTWATPAPITYGTALSSTQLDATANVQGTFRYNPAAGKVLNGGQQTLSVTFIPTLSADYTNATQTVVLTVNPIGTTTTITSTSPNPSVKKQAVTVEFTVTQAASEPTPPTGKVTVTASTGETCSGSLSFGAGSCRITLKTSGAITLTASYPGNASNSSSVSVPVTQTVN